MLSKRIQQMPASATRKLLPYAEAVEKESVEVIHLNIGQPDIPTPTSFYDAVAAHRPSVLSYANSKGIAPMIEATRAYYQHYGLAFDAQEILITAGASEALRIALTCLCDPGDSILVFEPFYTNYRSMAQMLNIRLIPVTTTAEKQFSIPDIAELERVYDASLRAVLLSNPCNPTGRVYTAEEQDTVVAFAKKHDLYVIADEVYREFNYSNRPFHSFAERSELAEHVVLLDSVSKRFSACGARIGAILSKDPTFMKGVLKLCQLRLAVSTLDQIGAAAINPLDENFLVSVRSTFRKRRDVLQHCLARIEGITASQPEGAFYTMVRLPVDDAERFIIWTLQNVRVHGRTALFTPAEAFYATPGLGRNEIRISYSVDAQKLEQAIEILAQALTIYPHRVDGKETK